MQTSQLLAQDYIQTVDGTVSSFTKEVIQLWVMEIV